MKKALAFSVISAALVFIVGFSGCKSENIQVIHNDKVVTNSVPVKAFNDEVYVWENWTFGTNKVEKIN